MRLKKKDQIIIQLFTVNLKLNGKIYSIGVGKNKQDAEFMAAEKALKEIDK